jgi:hypothetical protein
MPDTPREITGATMDRVRYVLERAGDDHLAGGDHLEELPSSLSLSRNTPPFVELCWENGPPTRRPDGGWEFSACDRQYGHPGQHVWQMTEVPF